MQNDLTERLNKWFWKCGLILTKLTYSPKLLEIESFTFWMLFVCGCKECALCLRLFIREKLWVYYYIIIINLKPYLLYKWNIFNFFIGKRKKLFLSLYRWGYNPTKMNLHEWNELQGEQFYLSMYSWYNY